MKLTVVFEVPDSLADTYADVASRLILAHKFADQQDLQHWSFDVKMRPVAAIVADGSMAAVVQAARREVDQQHPWIPGAVFASNERFKPALLALLEILAND